MKFSMGKLKFKLNKTNLRTNYQSQYPSFDLASSSLQINDFTFSFDTYQGNIGMNLGLIKFDIKDIDFFVNDEGKPVIKELTGNCSFTFSRKSKLFSLVVR